MTRTALITAASKGIGAGIARRLAGEGYTVGLLSRSEGVETLAAELGGFAVRGDVTKAEDIERLIETARQRTGQIDVVVSNTGHAPKKPTLELSDADWHSGLDILLLPSVRLARAAASDLIASKGAFIAISSYVAQRPDPTFVMSSALRSALANFVRILAKDWAAQGASANVIAPGFVDSLPTQPERLARIPAGRYGQVGEVAGLVAYLASPEARYISGQTLSIDGALSA
jgi:NAD(P)-dependent dehydrogenase (short-subunit alcohol dehydrogenase family)